MTPQLSRATGIRKGIRGYIEIVNAGKWRDKTEHIVQQWLYLT